MEPLGKAQTPNLQLWHMSTLAGKRHGVTHHTWLLQYEHLRVEGLRT